MSSLCGSVNFYLHNATSRTLYAGVQSAASEFNTEWEVTQLRPGDTEFQETFAKITSDHVHVFVLDLTVLPGFISTRIQAKIANSQTSFDPTTNTIQQPKFLLGPQLEETKIDTSFLASIPPKEFRNQQTPFLANVFLVDQTNCTLKTLGPGTKTGTLAVLHKRSRDGATEVVFTEDVDSVRHNHMSSNAALFSALGAVILCVAAAGWFAWARWVFLPRRATGKPPLPAVPRRNVTVLAPATAKAKVIGADYVLQTTSMT
jgi:hypothetical protein